MQDVLEGYAIAATADFIDAYDSLSPERIYEHVIDLMPTFHAKVADIGAGTGRDAAWFACKGHNVLAVEPVRELREAGRALHTNANINWLDDRLPHLNAVSPYGPFDLVILCAVWQHLPDNERAIAIPRLAASIAPSGVLIVSLRHGPGAISRRVFPASGDGSFMDLARISEGPLRAKGSLRDDIDSPVLGRKLASPSRPRNDGHMTDDTLHAAALASKAWPYEEARKLLKRYPEGKSGGALIVFECGYGPSGLPHIGTFNEVLRTTMVRNAFRSLSDAPTRLIEFSDDMDGLRKVPDNVPNAAMLAEHLGKPLSRIPDPFGTHESFAAHNNAMLRDFLDRFGFDYEFVSSSTQYESGAFDDALRVTLRHYDAIMGVMLPTLRRERAATYSPVLPISERTGAVLQVPVEVVDPEAGTIAFHDDGRRVVQSALGGRAKLQWKVDWAMRWVALGVDYEMYGKDLIDSGTQSGKIARILGGRPPEGFVYEMFLDERGEKISKSKGNGLSIEQWLTYGTPESLSFYAYREPKKAKSLHIGVIPRAVDEYFQFRGSYAAQAVEQRLGNPVHHIHDSRVPADVPPVTFGLLLNLVGVLGAGASAEQVRGYLANYVAGDVTPELEALIGHALAYNRDYVAPTLVRRAPVGVEVAALERLDRELAALPQGADGVAIQDIVYAIGNEGGFEKLRDWFQALYETLLGSSQGPRMGSFIALYGIENTRRLIAEALTR